MKNKKINMRKKQLFLVASLSIMSMTAMAQMEEPQKDTITLLQEQIDENRGKIKTLEKFKVSGYIQAQAEFAQPAMGTKTGANGGKYNADIDGKDADWFSRYGIRRGRIKFQYSEKIAKGVFQLDITEKGVGFKDAYLEINDPFVKMFSLKAGIFDRPFGDEISYSSSKRETPERSLIFQKLFPDERDLGASLIIAAPKGSSMEGLQLEGGLFSGNGIRVDDNSKLDFIGHLKYEKTLSNLSFGLGASMYSGKVNNADDTLYIMKNNAWTIETADTNVLNKRQYIGFDAQFSIVTFMGITNIRGEYLFGEQPSLKSDFGSPKSNSYTMSSPFNYMRKFSGGHVYLIQDIYATPITLVLKYSFLDPNTEVSGNDIKNKTDLSMNTFGFGAMWNINPALRLMAFYEMTTNEKSTSIAGYDTDIKDDLFTLRLQYKF